MTIAGVEKRLLICKLSKRVSSESKRREEERDRLGWRKIALRRDSVQMEMNKDYMVRDLPVVAGCCCILVALYGRGGRRRLTR